MSVLHVLKVDAYGTQQPIALLKILLEKGGLYGRGKELHWKQFKNISKYLFTVYRITVFSFYILLIFIT
jgi:hypothetical protein